MGKFKDLWEASNVPGYAADGGEPDTGFIRGDEKRTLGSLEGRPEPWFERGAYTQTSFPKADYIYGKGEEEQYAVTKTAIVRDINDDFEAHFDSWENWVAGEDFEEQNTDVIEETKYKKVMENILLERIDYLDIAQNLVKQYGLKSKVKFGRGKDLAEYVPETDTVILRRSYPTVKEFLLTILHEIGHALDAKRLGVRKYIKKYTQAGTMATYKGLDPHDDNKWEEKAERFARRELSKWL